MNDTFMKEKPVGPLLASMALPSFLISFLNSVLSAYSDSYVVILGIYYKRQTFLYLPGVFCISYRLRCSGRPGKDVNNKKALISQFHWKDQSFFILYIIPQMSPLQPEHGNYNQTP